MFSCTQPSFVTTTTSGGTSIVSFESNVVTPTAAPDPTDVVTPTTDADTPDVVTPSTDAEIPATGADAAAPQFAALMAVAIGAGLLIAALLVVFSTTRRLGQETVITVIGTTFFALGVAQQRRDLAVAALGHVDEAVEGTHQPGSRGAVLGAARGHRDDLEADRRDLLQVEQDVEHAVAVLAAGQAHHDLVAVFDHVEVGDGLAHLAVQALAELVHLEGVALGAGLVT